MIKFISWRRRPMEFRTFGEQDANAAAAFIHIVWRVRAFPVEPVLNPLTPHPENRGGNAKQARHRRCAVDEDAKDAHHGRVSYHTPSASARPARRVARGPTPLWGEVAPLCHA